MGSGGGQQTSTQSTYPSPQIGYWQNRLLGSAGPYYLGNQNMPPSLNEQVAPFSPYQLSALSDIAGLTGPAGMLSSAGMGSLESLLATNPTLANIMSNGGNLPALPTEMQTLNSLGLGGLTGMLSNTLSGKYLDPSTNPWLTKTYNEAAKGVTDQYQTSIAPSLMAEGELATGGGPGALANSSAFNQTQWQNQYGLGQNLQNLATNIYGGNYQQERQNQLTAAGLGESLAGQANQINEQNVANTEQGIQNRLQAAGLQQSGQLGALGLLPQTQSSLYGPANQLLQAGTLQQQQQQNVLSTLFQNALRSANWPQMMFSNFGQLLSALGGNQGTTITTSPNNAAEK